MGSMRGRLTHRIARHGAGFLGTRGHGRELHGLRAADLILQGIRQKAAETAIREIIGVEEVGREQLLGRVLRARHQILHDGEALQDRYLARFRDLPQGR